MWTADIILLPQYYVQGSTADACTGITTQWRSIRKNFAATSNVYGFLRHDAQNILPAPLRLEKYT